MSRRVLLLVVAVAAFLFIAAPAMAQNPESELSPASIDSDANTDRVGLVDPTSGIWFLRGQNGVVGSFFYGNPGDVPFAGDWNCDGVDTPGLYRQTDGFVYLRNSNTQGPADIRFFFGNPGDFPLAGDFDNDGCDTVSIYRSSEQRVYIINELGANDGGLGAAEFNYIFGNPGDKPFTGDFNGDGVDTIGLHRESTGFVYFRQSHTQGIADSEFFFGDPGDRFVTGDWGIVDGVDTPGLFRPSNNTFFFRHSNTQGIADESLGWGTTNYLPIAGNWGTVAAGGPGTPPGGPGPGGPGGPGAPAPLSIGSTMPNGVVDVAYSAQLPITGGVPPYTVTKLAGPIWANLSPAGLVTGTPLIGNLGSAHLVVRVTDSAGTTVEAAIVLTVVQKCAGVTAIPAIQCQALARLYETAGGNGWTDRTNWFTNPNPCTWAGVGCTGANVTTLRMLENNLVGTLPTELSNLTGLTQLDISENPSLTGPIPPGLFGITTLQTVVLAHNALSGQIPEFTAVLPSLTRLGLDSNPLGGVIPTSLTSANLPNLAEMSLDETQIGGDIPAQFFATPWTKLGNLRLDENQLTGDPAGFNTTNFPALFRLELGNNPWNGGQPIPTEIGTLTKLTVLDLSGANFTGAIPSELTALQSLTRFELNENQLAGAIPTGFIFPAMTVPGSLTLFGQTGCLTATGAELTFVSTQDPLWNDGCP
jgi:hypothetical protein